MTRISNIGGGSSTGGTLVGLTDVTITSPANLDVLSYSSATSKWVNSSFSGLGLITQTTGDARYLKITSNLSDLNNVSTARSNLGLGSIALLNSVSLTTNVTGTLPILNGGTGQTTANAALNAFLPTQTSNANKFLQTNGTNTSWVTAVTAAAGSNTQIQVNSSGSFAGFSGLTWNNASTLLTVTGTATITSTLSVAGISNSGGYTQSGTTPNTVNNWKITTPNGNNTLLTIDTFDTSFSGYISFTASGVESAQIGVDGNHQHQFYVYSGGAYRLTINKTTGFTAIGVTSPLQQLQIGGYMLLNNDTNQSSLNNAYFIYCNPNGTGGWGDFNYGMTLGYENSRFQSMFFAPSSADINLATHAASSQPTALSSFTSRVLVNGSTGNMGIGVNPPTAVLHLKAGTATASTGPLKFTTGTNLTTAEAGTMEFTTDDLYFTITTGAARKGMLLNDGSNLTSGKIPVATTNGRLKDSTAATLITGGIPTIVATTFEKPETGTDANVLTYTTGAADEYLVVCVSADVSALTGTSVVVTVTWKDSNNATATSSITLSGVTDGSINVPINAYTGTNVVISTTFVGVSTAYNISAIITRLK